MLIKILYFSVVDCNPIFQCCWLQSYISVLLIAIPYFSDVDYNSVFQWCWLQTCISVCLIAILYFILLIIHICIYISVLLITILFFSVVDYNRPVLLCTAGGTVQGLENWRQGTVPSTYVHGSPSLKTYTAESYYKHITQEF